MLTRRTFIKNMATGLLVAAAPEVLLPEPERKQWFVSRNAPVPDRAALISFQPSAAYGTERRLVRGYVGPLYRARLRDGTEVDVWDAADAAPDGSRTHVVSQDSKIVRYYDQSGYGRDCVAQLGHAPVIDPTSDTKALMREYFAARYGPAGAS
jgi:hypothetical protein